MLLCTRRPFPPLPRLSANLSTFSLLHFYSFYYVNLFQQPHNLRALVNNNRLLGALSRILDEDRKRSVLLNANILEIFFCFSSISELHDVLYEKKVGKHTRKVIELEEKRYELRLREALGGNSSGSSSGGNAGDDVEGGAGSSSNVKKMTEAERDKAIQQLAKNAKTDSRLLTYLHKQERLLFVSHYILLNLCENPAVERTIVSKNIIPMLSSLLERENPDPRFLDHLRLLALAFLKRLSVRIENQEVCHFVYFLLKFSLILHVHN